MQMAQLLRPSRILIATGALLLLGVGYSVYSRAADAPSDESATRNQVTAESVDVARAIGRLNQSYAIPPVISGRAFTGGSYWIDMKDQGDAEVAISLAQAEANEPGDRDASETEASESDKRKKIKLPPPLFIGDVHSCLPCWLRGDIGWMYGEGCKPICVDIPRPVIVARPPCGCPCHGHHPQPGCGCPCHGHHPHPHPHGVPHPAVPADESPEAAPQPGSPPAPTDAVPPPVETQPSVIKQTVPAAPGDARAILEEIRRLREEVDRLRKQLEPVGQASIRNLDA